MAKQETEDQVPDASKREEDQVKQWLKLIEAAEKREKNYRKFAREVIGIYEEESDDEVPFNVLYANTETLAPALYNSLPRPDTRPRSKVENATASASAGLIDAYLENYIDSGDMRYESFDSAITGAVLHALLPGRGLIRHHYRAEVTNDPETGLPSTIADESVFPEQLPWDSVHFGYAKKWDHVPWIAFEHNFSLDEAEAELGAEAANKLTYHECKDDESQTEREESAGAETARLFEIWCKKTKKIYWVEAEGKVWVKPAEDDPYKLEGFFPLAKPLVLFHKVNGLVPVPLYKLYSQQAKELNAITRRITKLIDAIKIRGFYDSQVEGLSKIFESEENTLIALSTLSALGQGAKAENAIYLVPIEKHILVLQQLIQDRQAILQVIYQVMGIADIMRGSSVASETLGAQEIKNKWGTLRLRRAQKAVGEFVRDNLRIAAELAFTRMQPQNLRMLTGSTLMGQKEADQMEQQIQMASTQGQQVPPEVQAKLALPTFEECLEILKSDITRRYVVDIETNSTIDSEASEDKENMADFLNAFSQFLNGLFPMVEAGVLPAETVKGVMITLSRRFRLGRDLDPYFQKIGQQDGSGAAQKKQLEEQAKQLAEGQKKLQAEGEKLGKEKQKLEKDKMGFEMQQMQAEVQLVGKQLQGQMKDAKAKAAMESVLLKIQAAIERLQLAQQAEPKESEDADV